MQKLLRLVKVSLFSALFLSCSSYYLASYYEDDGIYGVRSNVALYESYFSELAEEPLNDNSPNINGGLPWGAKPDSREVSINIIPTWDRFYYNAFYYNPYRYGRYGFGYPYQFRPYEYYFSPYTSYYQNFMYWNFNRYSRFYPWYNSEKYYYGIESSVSYDNNSKTRSRPLVSNSASRRGEKSGFSEIGSSMDSEGTRNTRSYSRTNINNEINISRNQIARYDRVIAPNLRQLKQNNLIGIYRSRGNYSRNDNQTRFIPNLRAIKSDVVRDTYQKIRFSDRNRRGNFYSNESNIYSGYNYNRNSSNSGSYDARSQMSRGSNQISRGSNYSAPRPIGRSGNFSSGGNSSRGSSGASKASAPSSGSGRNID